ncbi:MAG: hypothetical protein AABX01_04200 [Candidatus Micrarchaeota archaeon]
MPIRWKTSRIGEMEVLHWEKTSPDGILKALSEKPKKQVGQHPLVNVHELNGRLLAVRHVTGKMRREMDPVFLPKERNFKAMQKAADLHASVVETPFAMIRTPKGTSYLTLWKRGCRPLSDYLFDDSVPIQKKEGTFFGIARALGKLHAAGYLQGHLYQNMIVDKRGSGLLIDFTQIRRIASKFARKLERGALLALLRREFSHLYYLSDNNSLQANELAHKLMDRGALEYEKAFVAQKKRIARLGLA